MKHKKIKTAALGDYNNCSHWVEFLYSQFGTKKSYDYSDYYVETKPTKKQNKIK